MAAARLREVYGAETAEAARDALEAFDAGWGAQYPLDRAGLAPSLGGDDPFFAFSPEIRRVIYTTDMIDKTTSLGARMLSFTCPGD